MKFKRAKKLLLVMVVMIIITFGAFYVYTLDYYRADPSVLTMVASNDQIVQQKEGVTVFYPDDVTSLDAGFIFYPGGKVEAIAYAPLLERLAQQGIMCVLLEMPFNLAVFDINAANQVYDLFPEIDQWYLGGHSLGGAMASTYVGKNSEKLAGLILMGAYPVNDSQLPTIVIYGSEDEGLDLTKLENVENKVRFEGGNHAYFGNYGEQDGDGQATISREEQQVRTTEAIVNFIKQR